MINTDMHWPFRVVGGNIPAPNVFKLKSSLDLLCEWVNTHDCGVNPTGVVLGDSVVVRVDVVHRDGKHTVQETPVKTLQQARVALGY